MAAHDCPGGNELIDYLAGMLPFARHQALTEHIDACLACQELIPGLNEAGGTDVSSLIGHVMEENSFEREAECGQALARAESGLRQSSTELARQLSQSPLPRQIGDYQVLEKIAHGGLGVVYKARQIRLNRLVALKLLHAGPEASAAEKRRFQVEAEAAARLDHPSIVPIFEVGEDRGHTYISMALIEGHTLAKMVAAGPLPPRQAAELLAQVAAAVGYAHSCGVVHRDLKPNNILLDSGGRAHVTDFGLAKVVGTDSGLTLTGQVMGTPSFMPPEQAEGKTEQLGPLVDVYALGATLYCLITGRPPFQAASALETLKQVGERDAVPPRQLNQAVDRDLDTICLHCLEKQPARRYASASALADDLTRFLDNRPIQARSVTGPERAWRWCQRNPTLACFQAAVPLILILGIAVSWMFAIQANEQARLADEKSRFASDKTREAQDNAHRAIERSYLSAMLSARWAWELNRPDRVRELLEGQQPGASGEDDLRSFEWHHWYRLSHPNRLALAMEEVVHDLAISPDGKFLAVAGGSRKPLSLFDAATGRHLWTKTAPARSPNQALLGVAFSPDGKRLITGAADHQVRVWDAATGEVLLACAGHAANANGVAFNPRCDQFASASDDGSVNIWNAATGLRLLSIRAHPSRVKSVAYHPDGKSIASAGQGNLVRVWDAATGQALFACDARTERVHRVRFSPDGKFLAATGFTGGTHVWDAKTGKEIYFFPVASKFVYALGFSPDSSRLMDTGPTVGLRLFDLKTGQLVDELRGGHTGNIKAAAFFPDGRSLITAGDDETVRWWRPEDSSVQVLLGHKQQVTCVAASRDGRWYASSGSNRDSTGVGGPAGNLAGEVLVWSAANGAQRQCLSGHSSGVTAVAFCPQTGRLASAGGRWDARANRLTGGEIKLWNPDTGKELASLQGHTSAVLCIAISPDGRHLVSGGLDGQVILWDLAVGQPIRTFNGLSGWVRDVAFNPGGLQLAARDSEKHLIVWEVNTGAAVHNFSVNGYGLGLGGGVHFSPDGRRLAAGGLDPTVTIWDLASGQVILHIKDHDYAPGSVMFSSDGKRILTAGDDLVLRFWDAQSGSELLTFNGHKEAVCTATFSWDGQQILSGSWDGTVRVWNSKPLSSNH